MHEQLLKEYGLKITLPRLSILSIFKSAHSEHLSADEIYQLLKKTHKNFSIATIYRVLSQFEAVGLINRRNFKDAHSVYELNEGNHHDHLICIACGYIEEFFDEGIEQRMSILSEKTGFTTTPHNLNIYGYCPSCKPTP